jgi:hypothetical protein
VEALLKLNRKRSSLLILLTIDVPHTSLPYNSTGFTVWSNMCKSVFIFGLYKLKLFLNLSMKQENVHIKFCKFSLGVGKRTTNIAVLGELGRYPFLLEVI